MTCTIFQDVAAFGDVRDLLCAAWLLREVLTRENQRRWRIFTLNRQFPRHRGFHLVTRTPCAHAWRHTQGSDLLNRLVSWAIFAQTNRVVRVHLDVLHFHQCCHTHRVTRVFHKHQEGCTVRHKATVQRNTVDDGRHTKLTHTVVDVVA
ncbi:hypothetical protein VCSRO184_3032 [Vibrio cholerae]|nr:hypothetical protein VCSRO184_3032 [Vibrio cholerae]